MGSLDRPLLALTALVLAAGVAPIGGHHAPVEYDPRRVITVDATVAEVHWSNPHIWFVVDVPGARGSIERWTVEGNGTGQSRAAGLAEVLRVGNRIRIQMRPALDPTGRDGFFVALEFQGKTYRRRPGIEVE